MGEGVPEYKRNGKPFEIRSDGLFVILCGFNCVLYLCML